MEYEKSDSKIKIYQRNILKSKWYEFFFKYFGNLNEKFNNEIILMLKEIP